MAPHIEVGIIFNTRVGSGECRLEGVDAALERMGIVFDTRVEWELFLSSKGANRLCVGMNFNTHQSMLWWNE